jgi:hypothetical protein
VNIPNPFRRFSRAQLSAAALFATLAVAGASRAYDAVYASDCCAPGSSCCHPGAACCHGRHTKT